MSYSVRPMCQADLAQVTEIDREAFPTQLPPANYRQELQNRLAYYLVACDDSRIYEEPEAKPEEGLSKLKSRIKKWLNCDYSPEQGLSPPNKQYIVGFSGIWALADEAHITNIAVRQQYQRRGLGEFLLIATIDLAKKLKTEIMTLEVRASNLAAQSLYRKYGFTQVGMRRGYYLDNREDGIIMTTESITSTTFQTLLQQLRKDLATKWGYVLPE